MLFDCHNNNLEPIHEIGFANADSGQKRAEKQQRVLDKLLAFFEKYFGLL